MKEARYFYVPDVCTRKELPEDEALHAIRVLRLSAGDEMFLMDGQGAFYRATVSLLNRGDFATGKGLERTDSPRHCSYKNDGTHGMACGKGN